MTFALTPSTEIKRLGRREMLLALAEDTDLWHKHPDEMTNRRILPERKVRFPSSSSSLFGDDGKVFSTHIRPVFDYNSLTEP
jgi:hypothetical protein